MRIGIDARLWDQTGVGRYIRNLVVELQKIDTKNTYTLFVTPAVAEKFGTKKIMPNDRWKFVSTDTRWHTLEEQLVFYKVLENEYLDLMHFPYFSIPILYNKPFVITIHDLIINHFPTGKASTLPFPLYHIKRFGYQYVLKQAAKKAKKIITVSAATKKEIVEHLKVSSDKIVVTYEGVDAVLSEKLKVKSEKFGLKNQKYFLYVGNAYPHKNVERLVEAFALLHADKPQVQLVLVGKENYFYTRVREQVRSLGLENDIIFAGGVSDEELAGLYQKAEALVFPSLMEGFGLPGLEAMQKKCLVLASAIPVFKEIYKDAAVYFDPKDIEAIRGAMQNVLDDKNAFEKYKKKGLGQVSNFSWKKMAMKTLEVYESSVSV